MSLGPWPPKFIRDVSNRHSGKPHAQALGKKLFFASGLSGDGTRACASCHNPGLLFTDARALALGVLPLTRHTPSVVNLGAARWFGWGGESDSLWSHSIRPLLAKNEMGSSAGHIRNFLSTQTALGREFSSVTGGAANRLDDDSLLAELGKVLAAYQETLVTPRTAFDLFRDALENNNEAKTRAYPAAAVRGLKLFIGSAQCVLCHSGPSFTNGEFAEIGIPYFTHSGVDSGRYSGIKIVVNSRFNLLSPYNDDPNRDSSSRHTRHVSLSQRNWGEFKVPSLRSVAHTAPYMHNGSIATLREVVQHYSNMDLDRIHADSGSLLRPLKLTKSQIDDLLAFLSTLGSDNGTLTH